MYFDILFLLFLYKWNFFLGNIFIIFCQHCNIFLPESEFFECGNEFLSHLIYIFPNCIVFEICDWNFIIKIPDGIYCRLCIFQDNNIDQRFLHKKKNSLLHLFISSGPENVSYIQIDICSIFPFCIYWKILKLFKMRISLLIKYKNNFKYFQMTTRLKTNNSKNTKKKKI